MDLKKMQQELIDSMKAQVEAIEAAQVATAQYERELSSAMEAIPMLAELRGADIAARIEERAAKETYTEVKESAKAELMTATDPDGYKALDAFGYSLEKTPLILPDNTMVEQLIKMGLHSLLLPDRPLIIKFIKQNAIKVGNDYRLPQWLCTQWGDAIGVTTEIKPTISDAAITKLAKAK